LIGWRTASVVLLTLQLVGAQEQHLETGRIHETIRCRDDPDTSYALYLPRSYSADHSWPVLFVLDARGRGRLAVELFREAGERLGYVVVGSNDVESDGPYDPNLQLFRKMLGDVQTRLPLDERRVYLAGFSGMARFACDLGFFMKGRIAGVIAAGAGFSRQLPPKRETPFAFFATIGTTDFNYYELRDLEEQLPRLDLPHRVVYFDGAHGWPPPALAGQALEWMHLRAMKEGRLERSADFIEQQWKLALDEARTLQQHDRTLEAHRAFRDLAADFEGLRDVTEAAQTRARFEQAAGFKELARKRRKQDRRDRAYVTDMLRLLGQFGSPSGRRLTLNRLVSELRIDELRAQIEAERQEEERLRATRLLENVYVQTSFYVPNRLIGQQAYRDAALSLSLAARVKPDDPVVHYNLACAQARAGEIRPALVSLGRAVELGFDDAPLMESDPDLERLRGEPAFSELLETLSRTGKNPSH
jgi:predicted esterase